MNYRNMTTDELVRAALDADLGTLARELAERADAAIQSRNAHISELQAELADAEAELDRALNRLEDFLYDA